MKINKFAAVLLSVLMLAACAEKNADGGAPEETQPAQAAAVTKKDTPSEPLVIRDILPAFSLESGFYSEAVTLEITCSDVEAEIYYTTDGSEPKKTDKLYKGAIKLENKSKEGNFLSAATGVSASGDFIPKGRVDKANVIRAAAFYPDGSRSKILSGTFWVGIDRAKYGNVPIISLFTDTSNLFNMETGIYVLGNTYDEWLAEDEKNAKLEGWQSKGNYSNKGREWERPVTAEYFTADGKQLFVQDMGIRVMGAASRNEMQKSFRITARSDYGEKSVKYEIIPNNERSDGNGNVEKYRSFVLRNGGNDCNFAKIRDPYLQSLVSDRRFDTQQFTPCVVFLDGEYWGGYTLAEDYNDNYIENNYGIDNKNVIVVKKGKLEDGKDGDMALFEEMFDFITENDMTVPENYEKACGMLDMGSFADYCAFNLYIYNEDSIFKNNNWEMWRVRDADGATAQSDGKWRMMVYDTDYSTGIYSEGKTFGRDNISEALDPKIENNVDEDKDKEDIRHPKLIFLSLYENEDFRREFVNAMCDMRNIDFESGHAVEKLAEMHDIYAKIVPDTFRRFGPEWITWQEDIGGYFAYKVNELASFMDGRYGKFPAIMQKALSLGDPANLSLTVSDSAKGAVKINASAAEITDKFDGAYFPDFDITLTAVPKGGAKFVRWECTGCTVSDASAETVTVSFDGDFSVNAVFE